MNVLNEQIILRKYISEVFYQEQLMLESILFRGLGGLGAYGVLCWARNTVAQDFVADLIVQGGTELAMVQALQRGSYKKWLVGLAFMTVWNSKPDWLRDTPLLSDLLDVLNLLPQHESRHLGWTAASALVPVAAAASTFTAQTLSRMRPNDPASIRGVGDTPGVGNDVTDLHVTQVAPDTPWNVDIGPVARLSEGAINLGRMLRVFSSFVSEGKYTEALGFINHANFETALRAGDDHVSELFKISGNPVPRTSTPEELIAIWNRELVSLLLNSQSSLWWRAWSFIRQASIPRIASRFRRTTNMTNTQWRDVMRLDDNRLLNFNAGVAFLRDSNYSNLSMKVAAVNKKNNLIYFELSNPTPNAVATDPLATTWFQNGKALNINFRPRERHVPGGESVYGNSRIGIEWDTTGAAYQTRMLILEGKYILVARLDDVFMGLYGSVPDAAGALPRLIAPEAVAGAAAIFSSVVVPNAELILGSETFNNMANTVDSNNIDVDTDHSVNQAAYDTVIDAIEEGEEAATATESNCFIANIFDGNEGLWDRLKAGVAAARAALGGGNSSDDNSSDDNSSDDNSSDDNSSNPDNLPEN
jgi:hypothetical protein